MEKNIEISKCFNVTKFHYGKIFLIEYPLNSFDRGKGNSSNLSNLSRNARVPKYNALPMILWFHLSFTGGSNERRHTFSCHISISCWGIRKVLENTFDTFDIFHTKFNIANKKVIKHPISLPVRFGIEHICSQFRKAL